MKSDTVHRRHGDQLRPQVAAEPDDTGDTDLQAEQVLDSSSIEERVDTSK